MQRLEVSSAVRPQYGSLCVEELIDLILCLRYSMILGMQIYHAGSLFAYKYMFVHLRHSGTYM